MTRMPLRWMLSALAELGLGRFERSSSTGLVDHARLLGAQLMSGRGEASGTAIALQLVTCWEEMGEEDRLAFLGRVAEEYAADPDAIREAADAYFEAPGDRTHAALSDAVEPPRQRFLRRLNMAPGATAAIVDMRATVLAHLRAQPSLAGLEADMRHLLASWFNPGFLVFRQIDWSTSAAILEKLIDYEAVHEIRGWEDLRRRLDRDRRCFAFFHPALPDEPIIFIEVALTRALSARIDLLLDSPPDGGELQPTAAIFYSISNCQPGLAGISFGNFLIKQVVDALSAELPGIRTFATLSPIPGFRAWLDELPAEALPAGLDAEDRARLADPGWVEDEALEARLRKPLTALCAEYLVQARRRGRPLDPVARFHLGNGARVERINWMGDRSAKGLRQSAGLMVNYLYDIRHIVANHEAYQERGVIACSSAVRALLPPG